MPVQPARTPSSSEKWIAVASGLCIGDPAVDAPRLMLLLDWMKGMLGDTALCKRVCRLIICGAQPDLNRLCWLSSMDHLILASHASCSELANLLVLRDESGDCLRWTSVL